jgi:pSer/pThr/pTyr-binding forkhead associated (FHA) protein
MGAAAVLTISRDGAPIKSVPLDQEGSIVIGRGEDCVIRLEDRAISRQHAIFKKNGDVFQVEKKSEFAPLSVNGEEKTVAVLKEGDVIAIGPYLMRLSMGADGGSASAQEAPPVPPQAAAAPIQAPLTHDESLPVLEEPAALSGASMLEPHSDLPVGDLQAAIAAEPAAEPNLTSMQAPPVDTSIPGIDPGSSPELNSSSEATGVGLDPAANADASTRVVSMDRNLEVSLIFQPGQANVTEYRIVKEETSIGRGQNCDIVLNDKRASRKSAVILRSGLNFMIRDLGSSNGVFVNEERVEEKDLASNDKIMVGETEFLFRAVQSGYSEAERKLTPLPELPEEPELEEEILPPYQSGLAGTMPPSSVGAPAMMGLGASPNGLPDGMSLNSIAGIAGVGGSSNKKLTLIDKYKALPPARRIMVILLAGALVWLFLDNDDQVAQKPAPPPKTKAAQVTDPNAVSAKDAAAAFAALTPEQKKFVENQHELAFTLFQRKEYDRAIDEVSKIFTLVPDYKDSREIERYAREGKRRLDAALEEQRKREAEEGLKKKIAVLVNDAGQKMETKKYDAAREIFTQILALDPENKSVAAWQRQLQEVDEQRRIEIQKKIVRDEVNSQAWTLYKKGLELRKNGSPREAVEQFLRTEKIEASDHRPAKLARQQIIDIKDEIQKKVVPLLEDAKKFENAQDYVNAMHAYEGALQVDSSSSEAQAGMDRLRGILHERGKVIFTEAIIAESYSDFPQAKKKFQECLQATPEDDMYHSRCERKLSRYFDIGGGDSAAGPGAGGSP